MRRKVMDKFLTISIVLVIFLATVFGLFVATKLVVLEPKTGLDIKFYSIKIKSDSKPKIPSDPRLQNMYNEYYWKSFVDKEFVYPNKPQYASLWKIEEKYGEYLLGQFDPDQEYYGLPNLEFKVQVQSVMSMYMVKQGYRTETITEEWVECDIPMYFAFWADADWLHGNTEEQSVYSADIKLEITSAKHPIEEAYIGNTKLQIIYPDYYDKKHVQIVIQVPIQIAGVAKTVIVQLLKVFLNTSIKLEPKTTLTLTAPTVSLGTYTIPTTVIKTYVITQTIQAVITKTVVQGSTQYVISTYKITETKINTAVGTATVTVTRPTTITITAEKTTEIPIPIEIPLLPLILIIIFALVFFIALWYYYSSLKKVRKSR